MQDNVRILVLSTSLNPASKSRGLARAVRDQVRSGGANVDWVDLQEHPLPLCDGDTSHQDPVALALRAKVEAADGILLAAPVYNYDVNAAAKNLVELTGRAWTGKVVAVAVSAGGQRSGMSPMGLINSLMLDFRCIVLPRYVYATRGDYAEDGSPNAECMERIEELSTELLRITRALCEPA